MLLLYLEKRVVSEILPDQCVSPFYLNFYEYEMLIEREFVYIHYFFKYPSTACFGLVYNQFFPAQESYYRQICDGMHST